jgi:hypothetical protein
MADIPPAPLSMKETSPTIIPYSSTVPHPVQTASARAESDSMSVNPQFWHFLPDIAKLFANKLTYEKIWNKNITKLNMKKKDTDGTILLIILLDLNPILSRYFQN